MELLVIAYPDLTPEDGGWLLSIRRRHHELTHSILAPHFTLVFPLTGVSKALMAQHVKDKVADFVRLNFVLRCSIVVNDNTTENYFVMLVPDEGFSSIVKLHDRLYTGVLEPALRLDIPFIPHITIGYSPDPQACKNIVDTLNSERFEIKGSISRLDLVRKEKDKVAPVQQFSLGWQSVSGPDYVDELCPARVE
jgi:2'-5' RNA ligase